MTDSSRIVVARGPRATEARLIEEIEARLPPGALPPRAVVVVVPSHRLREHLLGLLAGLRPAWLGLEVATLAGLTASILTRTAPAPISGRELQGVITRRLAAREPPLARALGHLRRGYDEIAGGVRDLLDAGFVEEHLEAVAERLELERRALGADAVERAVAIARVAAGVRRELALLGLVPPGDLLAEAARRLATEPERALPGRVALVHGFADVTGVGGDLLEALVRHHETLVLVDEPPELDGSAGSWRFGARLLERLAGIAPVERDPAPAPAVEIDTFVAADPRREARAAVAWIARPPAGSSPERSALVAREPGSERELWRRELDRQGAAGSADSGARSALARRIAVLLEAMTAGGDLDLGVALALGGERLATLAGAGIDELRLAFAQLGLRRLDAAADGRAESVRLPVPTRIRTAELAPDAAGSVARREVPAGALAAASRWLRALRDGLLRQSAPRPLGPRLEDLRSLLRHALGEDDERAAVRALEPLARPELAGFAVDAEEWRLLVEECWRSLDEEPIGAGGGIALLSVTEARGRTFERLAVVGLTRDRFPRAVRPDPLLPDLLRVRLRDLLPDLPVKAEGHDEERYLFAQLVASADRVALLRPASDGLGRALAPSPLLEELARLRGLAPTPAPEPRFAAALDRAVAAGLARDGRELTGFLAAALEEGERRFGGGGADLRRVAAARASLLALLDFDPAAVDPGLGPFAGVVGPPGADDPRRREPSATALEQLARCGWRAFLERVLRVAALPELGDALPSLPRKLVGTVVHRVLEDLAPGLGERTLAGLDTLEPLRVAWPDRDRLLALVHQHARDTLTEEALDPGLFETVLVREASARLEIARLVEWEGAGLEVLGVEVDGEAVLRIDGVERRLPFRVDRVDRGPDGTVLTDYKTGSLLSRAVTPATRATHLAAAIARGDAMQLPLYLLGEGSATARARYLYLEPDVDERARVLELGADELDRAGFERLLAVLYAAWSEGAFPPRLFEPDGETPFAACDWCDVREACHQGDTAARQRFRAWLDRRAPSTRPIDLTARSWWELRTPGRAGSEEP